MEHPEKVLRVALVSDNQPGESFVARQTASQFSNVDDTAATAAYLRSVLSGASVWSDKFDPVTSQFRVQLVGIVCVVAY